MVNVKEIASYKDFGRCVSISNGVIEAYVTVDIGPRIIKFGYVDGQNIMCTDRAGLGIMTDKKYTDFFGEGKGWESFGGHRVWLTTESYPETYTPDDEPVDYEITATGAIFTAKEDKCNFVQKSFEILMDDDDANMQVKTAIKNIGDKDREFAVWCITVSAQGGNLIIPMNTNDTGLLHNRNISVWPYTDISDKRIYWGKNYVTIKQDPKAQTPVKLGFDLNAGTVYYSLNDDVFCKKYENNHPNGKYPDNNVSFETYTNGTMIEIENLSEIKNVAPGEVNTMVETWSLFKKPCEVDFRNDESIANFLTNI